MRRRNQILIVVLAVLCVVGVGFVVWAETPLGPMSEAVDALKSDSSVVVTVGEWLVFQPKAAAKSVGLIVYPGGGLITGLMRLWRVPLLWRVTSSSSFVCHLTWPSLGLIQLRG